MAVPVIFSIHNSTMVLDHRLALASFPASPSEAEQLIKKIRHSYDYSRNYGIEARMTFEPIRVDLGKRVARQGPAEPTPILFARLIGVDLLAQSGEVLASYSPDDFPTGEAAKAATAAARQARERQIEEAKSRAATIESSRKKMIETRYAECEAMDNMEEKGKCLKSLVRDRVELKLDSLDLVRLNKRITLHRIDQASSKQMEEIRTSICGPMTDLKEKQECLDSYK